MSALLLVGSTVAALASGCAGRAHRPTAGAPIDTIAFEPGEASVVVREPSTEAETHCDGPCSVAVGRGGDVDVELRWSDDAGERTSRVRLAVTGSRTYRARWVDRSGDRSAGVAFLVGGQLGALALAGGGVATLFAPAGIVPFGLLEGLATVLGFTSLIYGSYLAGLSDFGTLEVVPGVSASLAVEADGERWTLGVRGSF
jgi:hypothetical protein